MLITNKTNKKKKKMKNTTSQSCVVLCDIVISLKRNKTQRSRERRKSNGFYILTVVRDTIKSSTAAREHVRFAGGSIL